jgi:hypothetical protein
MGEVLHKTNQNLVELVNGQNLRLDDNSKSYLYVIINELAGKVNQYEAENKKLALENQRLNGVIDESKNSLEVFGDVLQYQCDNRLGQYSILQMQKSIENAKKVPKEYISIPKFKVAFNSLVDLYNKQVEKYFKI